MDVVTLPQNTESLLLYLLLTPEHSKRSRDVLSKMHNFEAAVSWLTENGYAYEYNDWFELTLAGMHAARQIQNVQNSVTQIYQNKGDDDEPPQIALPTVDTYPLRVQHSRGSTTQLALRYMLAFETPKNILPIPILDGDILGRYGDVNISVTHDEYISSQHCRFTIQSVSDKIVLCVEDLGSRNGTFVNKRRLETGQLYPLEHGTRLQIGSTVLKVVKIPD
jgi:pSer/pThr/pTyr-binding forkhead associated (FHA) protein